MCTCVTAHMWRLEGIFRSRHSPCRPPWSCSGCHGWPQAPQRSRLSSPFAKSLAGQSRLIHREVRRTWRAHFTEIRGLRKLHWEKKTILFTGYISKSSPRKGGRETETWFAFSLPAHLMNTPQKRCLPSDPPWEHHRPPQPPDRHRCFQSHRRQKYWLNCFSDLLHFYIKFLKRKGMKSIGFAHFLSTKGGFNRRKPLCKHFKGNFNFTVWSKSLSQNYHGPIGSRWERIFKISYFYSYPTSENIRR